MPDGTLIKDSPMMTWMRYAPFVTGAGPSLAGLLMMLQAFRACGESLFRSRRGRLCAWPMLAVSLLLPLGVIALPIEILDRARRFASTAVVARVVLLPIRCGHRWRLSRAGAVRGNRLAGFALPQLQRRYTALASSLVIGSVWAFWHWPNFVIPSDPVPWWQPLAFVPLIMALSVVFTWVYNSTGGSLFAVVVLHGAVNTALELCRSPDSSVAAREAVVFALLFAGVAVWLVWRYGAANLSSRDRVVAQPPDLAAELKP